MSLPPGFLDDLRTRVSLARIVGRRVSWDPRKSNAGKGDWWAPCPFHQEKSASFHVDDRKGYYYCFGCQAKGDAVSFLRESEGLGFMEAVERLAREAGVPMPAQDPGAAARAEARAGLAEAVEAALRFYRMQLASAAAAEARAYLGRRALSPETQARFELGYAGRDRNALFRHLTEKGFPARIILEAGLARAPEDGGAPYDFFRERILFPIRDGRGRAIGFGGRAMAADAKAKYLNTPETPLFDKGRSLFNPGGLASTLASLLAREDAEAEARARESAILVGCLGYPEIALAQESALERTPFVCADLARIRDALLACLGDGPEGLCGRVAGRLGHDPLEELMKVGFVRASIYLWPGRNPDRAAQSVAENLDRHAALIARSQENADSTGAVTDENAVWRLRQAGEATEIAAKRALAESEAATGDESSLSEGLQNLIDQQIWKKTDRR